MRENERKRDRMKENKKILIIEGRERERERMLTPYTHTPRNDYFSPNIGTFLSRDQKKEGEGEE